MSGRGRVPCRMGANEIGYRRQIWYFVWSVMNCKFCARGYLRGKFLQAATAEAKQWLAEGGVPIGSVLVFDGTVVGRGHNRRVQQGTAILHAEMDFL